MYDIISVDDLSPDAQELLATFYDFLGLEELLDESITTNDEYKDQLLNTLTHYCFKLSLIAQRIANARNTKEVRVTCSLLGQFAEKLSQGVIGVFLKVNEK